MQVWAHLLIVTFRILWQFDDQENQAKNDMLPCRFEWQRGYGALIHRNATAGSCRRLATCIPQNPSTWDLRPRLSLAVALRLRALRKRIATG